MALMNTLTRCTFLDTRDLFTIARWSRDDLRYVLGTDHRSGPVTAGRSQTDSKGHQPCCHWSVALKSC